MMLPATKAEIAALIPHQGAMCLHDAVVAFDEHHVVLSSHSFADPDHPLRRASGLSSVHLAEFGAQAMAVHGGLDARRAGHRAEPGLLVALREFEVAGAFVDADPERLVTEARVIAKNDRAWQYRFSVRQGQLTLATGRATVAAHA